MFFLTLALYAVVFVLSEFLRPKPKVENAKPASLGDFRFPTATEGRVVPIVWGTVKLEAPNVVWYGDFQQEGITKKVKTGLFSSSKVTTGYRYYLGVQMALCRGKIDSLRRIWVADKEVFTTVTSTDSVINISQPNLFGGDELGSGGISGDVAVYMGDELQGADPYLDDFQSPCPGYRGTTYVVTRQFYFGNSTSIAPWAFEVRRIPNGLGLGTPGVNSNADANPMNVIYEIMTNTDWGLGFPAGDIDVANFTNAANTLRTEGNGFSFVLDSPMEAKELLDLIQQQIDGVVYLDPNSGKWKVILARADYLIGSVPQADDSNVIEVKDFSRGSWDDTTNQVRVEYSDRARDYFDTSAFAQDTANQFTQGGLNVSVTQRFPGVKVAKTANDIAARTLRGLSFPLAKATLVVNREFYNVVPGMVIAWTNSTLGITQLPMRVTNADYGTHANGEITLNLVQDVFTYDSGAFADPPATSWTRPSDTLVAIPSGDNCVFEAPLAFCRRDPDQPGVIDRVWASGRKQGDRAARYNLLQRSSASTPSGVFTNAGTGSEFILAGELQSSMSAGATNPHSGVVVLPNPDTVARLKAKLTQSPGAADVGSNLTNLFLIDNEFVACDAFVDGGSTLTLNTVWRGLCDTAPANHAAGARVWLVRGTIADVAIPRGHNVHVRLQTQSRTNTLSESGATQISLTMADRARKPYPPVELSINGTRYPTGSSSIDSGLSLTWRRRDYRTFDEVVGVLNDASSVAADFPTANTTQYAMEFRNDPAGTNTLLFTTDWLGTIPQAVTRAKILRATNGAIPSTLRVSVKTRHTYEGTVFEALQNTVWDFTTTSALSGTFFAGVRAINVATSGYTAPTTGSYGLSISPVLATGVVEASINGGAYATVISAGASSGTLAGVTAGDTLTFRHTQAGTNASESVLVIDAPSSSSDAYAVFTW
jgi:hypothetical protein